MAERLFNFHNANRDIMVVPQEEGGTDDDNYFGSIGDATMKHVYSLSGFGQQMWQELLHMPSGDIYRMVPSWEENDHDPNNLRGKDLDKYVARFVGKVSKSEMAAIMEAVENEKERRLKEEEEMIGSPEDAMNQEIIPYEDWEKFPGHWSKMDIPSTPRDRAIYMGNTRQIFYDEFPEGHPDSSTINQFLGMFNRTWDVGLDFGFAEWARDQLEATPMKPYVRSELTKLVFAIAADNMDAKELTKVALTKIDRYWAVEYLNTVAEKATAQPMTQLLFKKEQEWNALAKKGFNVYGAIKQFGSLLFSDFRDQMTSYHWARYRRVRDKHAPKVILKGIDLNRCNVNEIKAFLHLDRKEATNVFNARPFASLEEAFNKGFVTSKSFADCKASDTIVAFMEKHAQIACRHKDLKRISDVRKILFKMQKDGKGNLSSGQWSTIWRYYRILKSNVLEAMNERKN